MRETEEQPAPTGNPDFVALRAEVRRACGWESIPERKVPALAASCGPAEIAILIRDLEALDPAGLEDDAGDVGDEYWRLRHTYALVFAHIGEPARAPLLQALHQGPEWVWSPVANALSKIGGPGVFEAIAARLPAPEPIEPDGELSGLKMSLMTSLGELGDPRALPLLSAYLAIPEQVNRGWLRRLAAEASGSIGAHMLARGEDISEPVLKPLIALLDHDPDYFVRYGAANGLAQLRHPAAIAALRRALTDAHDWIRKTAAEALPKLEGPA